MSALLEKLMPQAAAAAGQVSEVFKPIVNALHALVQIERPPENYNTIPSSGRTLIAPDTYDGSANSVARFGLFSKRVDIWLFTGDAIVSFSYDGSTFLDDLVLVGPSVFSFPFKGKAFRIRNRVVGVPAEWQGVFWT